MKKLIPGLLAMLLLMSGCMNIETAAVSSEAVSETSSEVLLSSMETSSEPESSEMVSSMDEVSSEAAVSEAQASSTADVAAAAPVASQAIVSSEAPKNQPSPPKKQEASSQEQDAEEPPKAAEEQVGADGTLPEYDPSKPLSPTNIPPDRRPMTFDEVETLVKKARRYGEDSFSVNGGNGYHPPAYSDGGSAECEETLMFNLKQLYELMLNDNYYTSGDSIAFKIEVGTIGNDPGWYIYVLR